MRVVLLSVLAAALLAACGQQPAPPPVENVTKETVGVTTDAPPQNSGHGFRTPPEVSGRPAIPVYPPNDEPRLMADPPPAWFPPEAKAEREQKPERPKESKKAQRPPVTAAPPSASLRLREPATTIDDILGQLRQGNMAFKVEPEMFIDQQSEATLLIDTTVTQKELEQLIGPGATGSSLLVSKVIVTKLIAPTFEVTAVTPERQVLIDGQPTKWQWLLRPLEQGKHKVTLSVTAVLKVDDQSVERFIVTFERDIFVHVTIENRLSKFWHNNWQWVISTLLLPLAVWFWHRRRKRA